MSSGVEAAIALDAAVIASLGLTRLMGGAAGVAGAGAGFLAAFAEGRAHVHAESLREAEQYEKAVRDVIDRNSTLAALTDCQRRLRAVEVVLPEPLELTGQPIEEFIAWCERVDIAVMDAQERLSHLIAESAVQRIFATPTESLGIEKEVSAPTGDHSVRAASLTRVLTRMLPDAAESDRQAVAEAAELYGNAATGGEAESRLTEVRIRIQDANRRTRDLRDGAAAAARFLRELEADDLPEAVKIALGDVAAGRRVFDAGLRTEAIRLTGAAQKRAEHRYVQDAIREAFGSLGYEVTEGFETLTAEDGEAVLTRGDWPQHAVKVRLDDARQVRMALLRTEPAAGDEQKRLDVEREEQWCESFEAARERLEEAGITSDVRWRVEPGEQQLPVVPVRQRPRQRPRERHQER
jgi:hypothetical protein